MSLTNENLNDLDTSIRADKTSQYSFYKSAYQDKPKAHLGKNIVLIGLIFLILIFLLFVTYSYQASSYYDVTHKYLTEAKLYISDKSAWFIDKTNSFRDVLTKKSAKSQSAKISLANIDASVQLEYYKAMSLLNEGLDEQALINLKSILTKYPNFEPAKNLYAVLDNR